MLPPPYIKRAFFPPASGILSLPGQFLLYQKLFWWDCSNQNFSILCLLNFTGFFQTDLYLLHRWDTPTEEVGQKTEFQALSLNRGHQRRIIDIATNLTSITLFFFGFFVVSGKRYEGLCLLLYLDSNYKSLVLHLFR